MNIIFYNFSKRSNSTAQPAAGATTLSCDLKDQTNMVNPTLVIKAVPTGWNPIWNYAHIAAFSRYYFINNWRWLNGVWECDCICDVLASFKTQIGALSEYVLRSSYEYNGQVVDLQYPTTAETRVNAAMLNSPFVSVFAGGYYVLGVISIDNNDALGAVTYYQLNETQMKALKHFMFSDYFIEEAGLDAQAVTDILPTELLKTMYNPYQYIASCLWMPFPATDYPSNFKTSSDIVFGWWEPRTHLSGYRLNGNGYVATIEQRVSVSGHPQRFDRGVFLDHAPFSDRMLFIPPYGSIPINDDSIIGGDSLRIQIAVDMVFGDSILTVFHDRPISESEYNNLGVIARVSAPLGVPIQLAQNTVDINGSANAMITNFAGSTIGGFVSDVAAGKGLLETAGNVFSNAPQNAVSAIGDVIAHPVGQLQTSGTNGSVAQYSTHPYFVQKWRIVADDDNAQKGRPLCEVKTLNTIPGFIMVDTPDVPIACMESERQQIIAFLSSGFYYE